MRTGAGSKERARSFSPFLEGPLVPATAPGKSSENQRGPPRWPPARFTVFLQCPVTTSMRGDKLKKTFNLGTFLKTKKQFSKSRSIDGSIPCISRMDRECVERIHRAYAVAMGPAEIGNHPAGQRATYFGRRGPWGAPTRTIRENKTTRPRVELEI